MREIMMWEALREALAEEMRRDEKVFVLGEDIALGYVWSVTRGLIEKVSSGTREAKRTWVFILDGTATKRGSYTKIENALQYREKSTKSKGKSTKAHTFLMGLLITDTGARIPVLPRPSGASMADEVCHVPTRDHLSRHFPDANVNSEPIAKASAMVMLPSSR